MSPLYFYKPFNVGFIISLKVSTRNWYAHVSHRQLGNVHSDNNYCLASVSITSVVDYKTFARTGVG